MNKINKNFHASDFSVEAMSCAVACSGCACPNSCSCGDTSSYYGSYNMPGSYVYDRAQLDARQEAVTYEMHYLG